MKKGFATILFLALIVIVLLSGGAYYLLQKQQSKSQSVNNVTIESSPTDKIKVNATDGPAIEHAAYIYITTPTSDNKWDDKDEYVITDVEQQGDWAVIGGYIKERATGTTLTPGGVTVIGHLENGGWKMQGTGTFTGVKWICQLPSTLMSSQAKQMFTLNHCP